MNFALIGAAGYVAPRHMAAIKEVGGNLIAAVDPHDSVGIIDRYFPKCRFFTEFERFDRYCSMHSLDYVSICSPNHLHDAHCRFALRSGAHAICEKPLVLNVHNIDQLKLAEEASGRKINVILQMRLHPKAIEIVKNSSQWPHHSVNIVYVAPRGFWYDFSWKGDIRKSGGVATNIGIHLFDMIHYLFDNHQTEIHTTPFNERTVAGTIVGDQATVKFHLSVNGDNPIRMFRVDGMDYDFSTGFENLHTISYQKIIDGAGFGVDAIREATQICETIRNQTLFN